MNSHRSNPRPCDAERALWVLRQSELHPETEHPAWPGDTRQEAQERAYRAMEADKPAEGAALAREALNLDGECIDAQVLLVRLEQPSPRLQARALRLITARAEAQLGTLFLQQHRGQVWQHVEARPFLRAKRALAEALERAGKPGDAVLHLRALMLLDPSDALDARTPLIRCHLASGELKPLEALLEGPSDGAFLAWATVLARLKSGNPRAALGALDRARRVNPMVEAFLTGREKLPRKIAEPAAPGSPDEAALAIKRFGDVWSNDREALYWLFKQG